MLRNIKNMKIDEKHVAQHQKHVAQHQKHENSRKHVAQDCFKPKLGRVSQICQDLIVSRPDRAQVDRNGATLLQESNTNQP